MKKSKKNKFIKIYNLGNYSVIKGINLNSNIDPEYEFFKLKEVKEQIYKKNLTYVKSLSTGVANVGNALIILNNMINICEKIRCKKIIVPGGPLSHIIKKQIFYKDYNITIFPNKYKTKIKADISLSRHILFHFRTNNSIKNRLRIIRNEVFRNIPKFSSNPNDLYINIRSGDIFLNVNSKNYAQPPLCFYQKIINENRYDNIFILSNGHENPVVDALLKLYPKIKFLHGSIEYDISIIVNAYNFVMPVSTFPFTLIWLNNKLKNLYVYGNNYSGPRHTNYIIHKLVPSLIYREKMIGKWNNTKEQLILMLNENCNNSNFTSLEYIKY